MKILVAVDQMPYSAEAVRQAAALAANTWADVTLLGLAPKAAAEPIDADFAACLQRYRELFLEQCGGQDSPYAQLAYRYELLPVGAGRWQGFHVGRSTRKQLEVVVRSGPPARQILEEAAGGGCDLVALGCPPQGECAWEQWGAVPQRVAEQYAGAVWIVKQPREIRKILCCLDHELVSQASLEMISQMVTLHGAELDIVALADDGRLREAVAQKLDGILQYYHGRGVEPLLEVVRPAALEAYISQEARWGLMALWMGRQSIVEKALKKSRAAGLIRRGAPSVLILR